MTNGPRTHLNELRRFLDPDGLDTVDIGAGDGAFARLLGKSGARAAAVEIDQASFPNGDEKDSVRYLEGTGEALPIETGSMDLATFLFSFHHVPEEAQAAALAETRRILLPKGRLHVVEPLPKGSMFAVVAPLEDETEVLTRSRMLLENAPGFRLVGTHEYAITYTYASAGEIIDEMIDVDPQRAARADGARAEIERLFAQLSKPCPGGFEFEQPSIAYHYEIA